MSAAKALTSRPASLASAVGLLSTLLALPSCYVGGGLGGAGAVGGSQAPGGVIARFAGGAFFEGERLRAGVGVEVPATSAGAAVGGEARLEVNVHDLDLVNSLEVAARLSYGRMFSREPELPDSTSMMTAYLGFGLSTMHKRDESRAVVTVGPVAVRVGRTGADADWLLGAMLSIDAGFVDVIALLGD